MATATSPNPLRVVRQEPLCAETRLEEQRGLLTGNDRFYVRSNFPDPSGWSGLRVSGAVKQAISLGFADLSCLATRDLVVTMECAGNGRSFFDRPAEGEQWGHGAVSTACWTGVPLLDLLDRAGLLPTVVEVVFEGGDGFARSLPIDVARDPDTLLATAMNGSPLPQEHGGPLRLIVPRWYGMASVKWVEAVVAVTQPFDGHFQVERYVIDGRPVREMLVRAVISEPAAGSVVASTGVRLSGYAWSGAGGIACVEVSDDGGRTWTDAKLLSPAPPHAWTRWWLDWVPSHLGEVAVLARARDTAGNVQPLAPSWNQLGYCNNSAVPHRLVVAPDAKEAFRWL